MSKKPKIMIFDLRPNIYKIGIYKAISNYENCTIIFLNDLGVDTPFYDERFGVERISDTWLLNNLDYRFVRRKKLLRIFEIIMLLLKFRYVGGTHVLVQGYNKLDYWLALLVSKTLLLQILFRGEGTLRQAENFIKFSVKSTLLHFIYLCSKTVFYTCTGNKKYYEHYLSSSMRRKLKPLSCAVDNNFYTSRSLTDNASKLRFKRNLNIDIDKRIVLFVGELGSRKRPRDVIDTVTRSLHKDNIVCLFVGSGSLQKSLQDYANLKRVNAVFAGFVDQEHISNYYSISDVFILPSEYDNSPKVLNEAMNFGLPSIVSNACGQSSDLINTISKGYVVEVGDVNTMAHALDSIVHNLEDGTFDRSEILNHVSKYNFERNAQEVLDAL